MKKIIVPTICIILILLCIVNLNKITDYVKNFVTLQEPFIPEVTTEYAKDYSLSYVEKTDSFIPYSNQDLMNILYSAINNRWENFTFYCPSEYESCEDDMSVLSQDDKVLTHINNFVHPYNSFTNIKLVISESGEINAEINYLYGEEKINIINEEVDKLISQLITSDMDDETKIKTIHDHIINNSKYDVTVNKNEESIYDSSTAYGPLFEGYAICNGYTDLMAIFLTKLGYKNIKIATTPDEISYSTTGHIWNAVYLNDSWLHIDLTWDDPVSDTGKDYLFDTYFLVDTATLHASDEGDIVLEEHHFNEYIYYELKK